MASKAKREPQKFTEHFGLHLDQSDLEFVDIYAEKDMDVYLDPYGISAMQTEWSRRCEVEITSYFQYLIDCIRSGDSNEVAKILGALHEVNEIALGKSKGVPNGRGIGHIQAKEIQFAFENSEAGKSGDIKDIADCALMIPGINHDKISDITANILKKKLIVFTQEQCRLHGIPMKRVPVNSVFDLETFKFRNFYTELPVIKKRPKILLPIYAVRYVPELSKDKYYRKFVLEFLKAEHEHAGDSLSSVLKNGTVVVRIKDLKRQYPIGTDLLYNFSKEHPEVLAQYKEELRKSATKNGPKPELKTVRRTLTADDRIRILRNIPPGNDGATAYHKISFDSLIHILGHRVSNPFREKEINEGRKRIDIVFDNSDSDGFFYELNQLYHVKCPKIFAECKNYGKEIGNPEMDQLAGRFTPRRGKFGILLCRSIDNMDLLLRRCKDALDNDNYMIVLDDLDFEELLRFRGQDNERSIDDMFRRKLDQLIM